MKRKKSMINRDDVVERGVALWDIHYPDQDDSCMSIVHQFVDDFNPDYFLLCGDQLDMASISYYNRNKPKLVESKRLAEDYKGFQRDVLDKFDNILDDRCLRYFFIGNHEYRAERIIESDPQYEGFIEPEINLDLSLYKVVPFNGFLTVGKMNFIHGIYINKYNSNKHLSVYEDNVFYGHTHSNQVFTKLSPFLNLPRQAVNVGCLCNKNPSYMRSRPNSWVHQFLFWYMFDDGSFVYYTPIIINDKCFINGKLYHA